MGKDNVYFHTIFWPSIQLGDGRPWTTLHHLSTTGKFCLEHPFRSCLHLRQNISIMRAASFLRAVIVVSLVLPRRKRAFRRPCGDTTFYPFDQRRRTPCSRGKISCVLPGLGLVSGTYFMIGSRSLRTTTSCSISELSLTFSQ
jgi:hypothetical protein